MLLRYFYDEKLAQASYLVGCVATGEALVVDPMRNVTPYLRAAEPAGALVPTKWAWIAFTSAQQRRGASILCS